jgi:hypothetical protein
MASDATIDPMRTFMSGVVRNGVIVVEDQTVPLEEGQTVDVLVYRNGELALTPEEQAELDASVGEVESSGPTRPWREVLDEINRKRANSPR